MLVQTRSDRYKTHLDLLQRPAVDLDQILTSVWVHVETHEARGRFGRSHSEHARDEHDRASRTRRTAANETWRVTG